MWFFNYISYKYGLNISYFITRFLFIVIYFVYLYYYNLITKYTSGEFSIMLTFPVYILAINSCKIFFKSSVKEKSDYYIALVLVFIFNLYMIYRLEII